MKSNDSLSRDNSGVSVLLEYVFVFIIMTTFFALLLMLVNSTLNDTDQAVVGQELGVIANDIASRITGVSHKVNISNYNCDNWTSDVSGYSETINLPALAQGKQYSVAIMYSDSSQTGNVTVTYGSNSNIYRTASFRSGVKVADTTIRSSDASPGIFYFQNNNTIVVGL